jgi:hypothetical protein
VEEEEEEEEEDDDEKKKILSYTHTNIGFNRVYIKMLQILSINIELVEIIFHFFFLVINISHFNSSTNKS